jgi:hypothetical protein
VTTTELELTSDNKTIMYKKVWNVSTVRPSDLIKRRSARLRVGLNAVGRLPENDIVLARRYVSRRHCVFLVHTDGGCEVHDTASRNGTLVNRNEPVPCAHFSQPKHGVGGTRSGVKNTLWVGHFPGKTCFRRSRRLPSAHTRFRAEEVGCSPCP